jgi:hypothetical protein
MIMTTDPNPQPDVSDTDLFAVYGEALFLAQAMETGMRIFYWLDKKLPEAPPGKLPRIDFTAEPLNDLTMNSLGGFLRQFKRELLDEGTVDVQTRSLMRRLEKTADARNYLVHTYWWERAAQISATAERQDLLAELRGLVEEYRWSNRIIRQLVLLCLSHYHFNPEQFEALELQGYLSMSAEHAAT